MRHEVKLRRNSAALLSVWLIIGATTVGANDFPPEPLQLTDALAFADNNIHPATRGAELDYEQAQADASFHNSSNQLKLEAIVVPQRVDRVAPGADSSLNDSYATLRLTHPLYDFGRKKAAKAQANLSLDITRQRMDYVRAQKQVEILRRFFDVLIADLEYGLANEKMTLAFLRYSRYQEEFEMFEAHAEVDVLDLETIYRERFTLRQAANFRRIDVRRNLGIELGYTDYIPRDLATPDLSRYVEREVPEFDQLLEQILSQNYDMQQAKLGLEKAQQDAQVSESKYQPQLDAVLEATKWQEETGSRNAASIGLRLHVPLVAGEHKSRDKRMSQINIERAQLALTEAEHEIRKRAFKLWKSLSLHHLDLSAAQVRLNYRDQYMDRARTLYELEESSDLGDAQAELLRALLEIQRSEFNLALTWSEIDALMGNPVYPR